MKPSIPKGTRDFTPEVYAKRKYIFNTIESVFKNHGFQPIETPSVENLSTLTGKYGAEGDRLIFKILNSGDYLSKISTEELSTIDSKKLTPKISDKALRYDLTVPFARFVVMNRNEITFPFKRYQIQPVWRADRPQKGRYREFYQCDVDVIGSDSILSEVELIQIIDRVFRNLNIPVTIHINHRKVLDGILQEFQLEKSANDILVALDKLDKLPLAKVKEELSNKIDSGLIERFFTRINDILACDVKDVDINNENGKQGVKELNNIFDYLSGSNSIDSGNDLKFDVKLARGLDYYTGAIIEVKAKNIDMSSICGGGRYDELTSIFGLKDISGVGISFGADRIYDVLESQNKFKDVKSYSSKVMFVNFGDDNLGLIYQYLNEFRETNISCELYPDSAKLKKQFAYANFNAIPYVAIIGAEEIESGKVKVKNMQDGTELFYTRDELINILINE